MANELDFSLQFADVTCDNTIEAMASRLWDRHEGQLVLVGHSMGARVAIEMVRQQPSRILGLVLANTGHTPLQEGEREKRQAKIDLGHRDMKALVVSWLPSMLAEGREQDVGLMADLTDMALGVGAVAHQLQIEALISRPNATV